jgi:ABC-type enterochelin transport system substrate-binding protein
MNMENGLNNVAETIPMTVEDLKDSKTNLESLQAIFSKDPAMMTEATDIKRMITNIENRIAGLQN